MLPDQEKQSQVNLVSGFTPASPCSNLEDAQAFLQRAAVQLKVEDQAKEKLRDMVAAFVEQSERDSFEKDVVYDLSIDDRTKMELEFMNPKKLAEMEFKLSLTPSGLAALYIRWLHASLGTHEPNLLTGWLKKLEANINERYPYATHRLFRGAERQLFALVGMYAAALLGMINEFCAALSLEIMATACFKCDQHLSPELNARLAEQSFRLSVWEAMIKIIEDDHLHEPVVPAPLRSALDPNQLKFVVASSLNLSKQDSTPVSEATELAAEAHSRVTTLLATARASASLSHCHELLFSLAQATLTLGNCRRDYELSMDLIKQVRRDTDPLKKPPAARTNGYPRSARPSKLGRPTKKTTSATRRPKPKPIKSLGWTHKD